MGKLGSMIWIEMADCWASKLHLRESHGMNVDWIMGLISWASAPLSISLVFFPQLFSV